MLLKVVRNNFRQILHPNAVLPVKINGMSIPQSKLVALFAFFTLTMLMTLVTATIMIVAGIDNTNAITIALSCVSNVGPTLGTQTGDVVVDTARIHQVDSVSVDADGTSGDYDGAGTVYTYLLEGELKIDN